jgi:MerR family transcriptional regulator, light-induced transcriptional regulator
MLSNQDQLPIRTLSALTGVNAITLRAWERRYGLLTPMRTPKGHRLYTRQHVDRIQRVLALVESGVPISRAREALDAAPHGPNETLRKGPWRTYLKRMAEAIARFDEGALDDIYDEVLSQNPIDRVSKMLLGPLLAFLGERWKLVSGGIAEEHFFCVYLRNKLGARLHHRRQLTTGPRLLLACGPGEYHEIGLLLFALAAHDAGMRVVILGASTPIAEIGAALRRAGCDAVVISSVVDPDSGVLERDLPAMVEKSEVPVFFGGSAADRHRALITAAGAIPLGVDIDAGVRTVATSLTRAKKRHKR